MEDNMIMAQNNVSADNAARDLFFKRNEQAAIRTLYELEKEAGATVDQTAESVLENVSSLIRVQREEFGTRQCRFVPLAVMRNVWMVKTGGHGREMSEETTYLKDTDTVSATVVLGDGFGGEYKTTREKPVDRSGFDTEAGQILRSKDMIRGTAWSACYSSVQANNGYSKVYLDDTADDADAQKETEAQTNTDTSTEPPKKKTRQGRKKTEDALAAATAETAPVSVSSPAAATKKEPAAVKEPDLPKEAPAPVPPVAKAEPVLQEEKPSLPWPEKPLREVSYEEALATPSPFLKWKLGIITGIGEKPGIGNKKNAISYIEKALSRGETFENDDVNAMLTIIMNNDDMKADYDRRRKELMTA